MKQSMLLLGVLVVLVLFAMAIIYSDGDQYFSAHNLTLVGIQ